MKLGIVRFAEVNLTMPLEVFDRNGNFKFVLNLDGTKNIDKTNSALGRRIPKK